MDREYVKLVVFVSAILLIMTAVPVDAYTDNEDIGEDVSVEIENEIEAGPDRLTIESLFDRGEQLEDDHPYDMDTIQEMTQEDLNWTNQAIDKEPDWNLTYEDPETGQNKSLRIIEGTFGGEEMLGNNTYRMYPKEQMQSGDLTEKREVNLKHGGILILPHDHENASGKGNGMFMHTHSLPSVSDDLLVQQLLIAVAERFEVPVFLMGEFSQNWEIFNFTSEDDIIYPSLMPGMMKNNASSEYLKMFYGYALVRGNLLGHTVFERLNEEFGLHLEEGILSEGGSKQGHARYFAAMLDDRIEVAQADLLMLQDKINATSQYYKDWGRPPIQDHTGWANYSNQIASITTAIGDSWTSGIQDPNSPTRSIYEVWDIHHQAHLLKDVPLLSMSGTLGVGAYDDGEYVTDHDGTYFPLTAESNFLDRLDDLGVEWRYGKERSTILSSGYPLLENRMYSNALNGLSVLTEEEDTLNDWPKIGDVESAVEGYNATHDRFNVTAEVENPKENMTVKLRFAGNSDRRWNDPEHVPDVGEHPWQYENMTQIGEEDGKDIYEVSILIRNDLMYGHYVEVESPGVDMYLFGELVGMDRYDISPVRLLNEYEPEVDGVTDFFVDDYHVEPEYPGPGDIIDLTLDIAADRPKIWLMGPYESLPPLRNIDVELEVDGEVYGTETITITEEKTIDFSWTVEDFKETVKVTVDSGNVLPDYNEDNNTLEFEIEAFGAGGFRSPYDDVDWDAIDHHDANFHAHTTESDGDYDPDEVIDMYREEGYDILAITDHDTETDGTTYPWTDYGRDPDELGMVAVEGNEISYTHHIGSHFNDYPGQTMDEHEAFQQIGERDGLAMFYHPGRYSYTVDWYLEFYREYDHLVGMEVYNREDAHPGDREFYDNVLHELLPERPMWLFGNDDMHSYGDFAWNRNMLPLEELNKENVRQSVENGSFYLWKPNEQHGRASFNITEVTNHGYGIEIEVDEEVDSIDWMTFDPESEESKSIHQGPMITLDHISEDTRFVRAEIEDSEGKIYTQPFWLEGTLMTSPEPEDVSIEVDTDPELSVRVIHPEEQSMNVSFYDASDDDLIGKEEDVRSGARANTTWQGLEQETTYEWYVVVDDGEKTVRSEGWTFTTEGLEPPYFEVEVVDHDEEVVEGEEVVVEYKTTNTGDEEDTQVVEFTVDDTVEDSVEVTLGGGEVHEDEFSWITEEEGEFILKVASEDDEDEVTVNVVEEVVEYELTIEVEEGGTTDPEPDTYTHEQGTEVPVEAIPDEGWEFSHWEGDVPEGEQEEAEITIYMDDDKELTAQFEEDDPVVEYELTIDSTEGGSIGEPGEGTFDYEEGTEVNVTATPDEGWYFDGWTGDIPEDEEGKEITMIMDNDKDITAHFEEEEAEFEVSGFHIDENALKITVTADVENVGDAEGTIELMIAGEAAMNLTVGPGENETLEYTHEFEEEGEYTVELGDESETVNVEDEEVDMMILGLIALLLIVLAAIVYMMKSGGTDEVETEEATEEESRKKQMKDRRSRSKMPTMKKRSKRIEQK